ncbi:MAG: hypothetical protein E7415_02390 [Ruminococcaceae bacterium]|nr:hypothetical protein [Oscillospiraceae bacterium]
MKKFSSIILIIAMLLSLMTMARANTANPFTDVPAGAWYHDEVVKAVETEIINGKTTTIFAPDDLLTYAEAVKLAACMSQVYLNGEVTLTTGSPWYQPYVDYCKSNRIITKDYDFNANVTRAGYIEIFANALPDSAFKDINNIPNGSILDVKDNAPYAIYVYKMYRAGIITGVDALHNCKPDDNIKRCEVAAIISRMMNEDERVKFEMAGTSSEEEPEIEEPGKDNQKAESWDDPVNILPENPEVTEKIPTQEVNPNITVTPTVPVEVPEQPVINAELTIHKQPEGAEYDDYGRKHEAEVQVFGGKAPYSYQWFYYTGYRNQTAEIENGDYVKDVKTEALVLSVEKENTLLGKQIYCEVTDSLGEKVKTDRIKVYGPFSMPIESYSIISATKEYTLSGTVADGILKKGEKVSVIRNDKVIAIGVAKDLQMFNKSLDEICKNDNAGIVFAIEDGATPKDGDVVVKYQPTHVIDMSDIIN